MTSKALFPFCKKAYRNFRRQRKKENSVRVFRQSKPGSSLAGPLRFLWWKGSNNPTPNATRKRSAAATMIRIDSVKRP
jgi:hypothetical protein